ncbi:MAG TPA: hypothetical protein VF382_08000 [Actinomycetota bacterium]
MPAPVFDAPVAPRRSTGPLVVWLAAGAVVAAAIAWFVIGRPGGPELPDSVGGFQRIEVPNLDQAIEAAKSQSGVQDVDMDIGVYGGTEASPRIMVMWATSDQFGDVEAGFVGLASGFGLPAEAQADFESFTRGDQSFLCASSSDLGVTVPQAVDMCMWPDEDTIWILADYSPGPTLDTTLELADQVARETA